MSLARIYGETLGLIAFAAVLLRGVAHGADLESAAQYALVSLFAWGFIGCFAGMIANRVVSEAVRGKLLGEMKQRAAKSGDAAKAAG